MGLQPEPGLHRPKAKMATILSPEAGYRHMSPQLAARTRQLWSARGLDFDLVWRTTIAALPGFRRHEVTDLPDDSHASDRLFLFDQGIIWVRCLREAAEAGRGLSGLGLTPAQLESLAAVASRLGEELAALRLLQIEGLATPALQVARSVSEDVDMALVLLLRPRVAEQFATCRTLEQAEDFWRRHISGGRAFRVVAEQLYAVGLDHSDDSEYGRWRKQALQFLGTAVHTSFLSGQPRPGDRRGEEALRFAALRIQELCAYAHVLSWHFHSDLLEICRRNDRGGPASRSALMDFAALSGEIIVDQMHWLLADRDEPTAAGAVEPS